MSFQIEATGCLKKLNHFLSYKLPPLQNMGSWNTLYVPTQTNSTVRNHSFGKNKILLVGENHFLDMRTPVKWH